MFTKYFGLLLIVGGIISSFISLFFNGLYIDRYTRIIKINPDLSFGILISITIILTTFFIGKYLYKTGKIEKTSTNLKINKFVKIAVILFVASILIIPVLFFVTFIIAGPSMGDGWALMYVFAFGVVPAMIMSGIAIILLIIHWYKFKTTSGKFALSALAIMIISFGTVYAKALYDGNPRSVEQCDRKQNIRDRDVCHYFLSGKKPDLAICEKISDTYPDGIWWRGQCYIAKAQYYKDSSFCDKIKGRAKERFKEICLDFAR